MSNHETNITLNNLGSKHSVVMKFVIGMKKESDQVCILILTYFYGLLAITYLIQLDNLKKSVSNRGGSYFFINTKRA